MGKGESVGCGSKDEKDFYGVLGLKKECTEVELRSAYKKLAMIWHPDRCFASGNVKSAEEAKKKFQDIQEAYSVLLDSNKRFLYDAGVYDKEEDDEEDIQELGDFLNEMAVLMQQNKPDDNGGNSFKNLQELFHKTFQAEIDAFSPSTKYNHTNPSSNTSFSFSFESYNETANANNKRSPTELNFEPSGFDPYFQNFCTGIDGGSSQIDDRSKRRNSSQTSQ